MTKEWQAAVLAGDVERLAGMLAQGVDIDALDRYGQTGLMLAAMHGRPEVIRFLVDGGAALDRTAKFGLSALMLAVINGHVEIVRMLVQAGADTELRGSGAPGFHDKNARGLAVAQGRDDVLAALDAAPSLDPPTG